MEPQGAFVRNRFGFKSEKPDPVSRQIVVVFLNTYQKDRIRSIPEIGQRKHHRGTGHGPTPAAFMANLLDFQ